jgi:hypothetical protein
MAVVEGDSDNYVMLQSWWQVYKGRVTVKYVGMLMEEV